MWVYLLIVLLFSVLVCCDLFCDGVAGFVICWSGCLLVSLGVCGLIILCFVSVDWVCFGCYVCCSVCCC